MSSANQASVIAVGVLFPVLGAAAVALRFISRSRGLGTREIDDWLCVPALVMVVACGAILIAGGAKGVLGADVDTGDDTQLLLEKLSMSFSIIQSFGTACVSLSVIFLYRRLFCSKGFRRACLVVAGFLLQWLLTFVISIVVFGARRIQQASLDPSDFDSSNSFIDALLVVLAVEAIVIHAAILILPAPMLFKLPLSVARSLFAAACYLVGSAAVSFGIIRLALPVESYAPEASALDLVTGVLTGDDPPAVCVYLLWGMIEIGSLLIVACLPALEGLVSIGPSGSRKLSSAMSNRNDTASLASRDEEAGWSIGAAAVAELRCESRAELDPKYKFLESHVSIRHIPPTGARGESPAPEGQILVGHQITQVVETI